MNELTIPLSIAGVLGLALAGLIFYARWSGAKRGKPGAARSGLSPSEQLVDVVDILEGQYFLTTSGSLVALFHIQPVLSTTDASPDGLAANFVSIVHALEAKSTIQIVQLPLPSTASSLTDRYALTSHTWRTQIQKAQAEGDDRRAETAQNRYFAAMQIGSQILEVGGSAPHREAFVVISRSPGLSGKVSPVSLQKTLQSLKVDAQRLSALFQANGMPIVGLSAREALEVLWHAYNPDRGEKTLVEQEGERFAHIMEEGTQDLPLSGSLTQAQIERVLSDPREELRRVLAPIVLEEGDARIRFQNQEMLLYFVTDYRFAVPAIRRLYGRDSRFAHRLYVSYYITSPSSDEMARSARKASTAKQALATIAQRAGSLPSYKEAEEVLSIEEARAGAETEKNVTKMLGLYIGLLTTTKTADADAIEIESILRSAGVEFVPARWMALDVWRTLLPLGQRFHIYEERNLFSSNLAPLNPVTGVSLFDPEGEFCGFVGYGENAGMPVAIQRKRGGEFVPSDAIVGAQNSGKSFTLKFWITDWIARGQRAFVVDPKLEFREITHKLGGSVISLRGARGFNLLQFDQLPATPGSDLGVAIANLMFEDNLSALEALYTLAKGTRARSTGVERNLLINALKRAMTLKGMDPKNAATWQPNQVFLIDVYEVLTREMQGEDPETIRMMAAVLEQYATREGQYFDEYNTPNDFSLDADLVTATFGLSELSTDDTAKSLSAHFAMRMAASHAVRSFLLSPQPVPFHIVIDEASQLLTTPALVSSVVSMLSLLSAYGISVHLAFQTMEAIQRADALGAPENAASMNTLSGTIPAYWLFHQEPQSAEKAVEMLGLPRAEAGRIVSCRVGQCILVFPKADLRIPLTIAVPHAFHPLFATDPAAMRRAVDQALVRTPDMEEAGQV